MLIFRGLAALGVRALRCHAVAVTLFFLVAPALTACGDGEDAGGKVRQERPVLTATVHYAEQSRLNALAATIRPKVQTDTAFRISGKVIRRLVNVGDRVRIGQPLAVLEQTDQTLRLEQAEAEERAAQTALAHESAEEDRVSRLRQQGWASDSAFERQKASADAARSRLESARKATRLARNALGYATLTATAEGVVTATAVDPGQVVAAGQPAISIAQLDAMEAEIAVPESLARRIADLKEATVALWSAPDHVYRATLRELDPVADPVTRTYKARLTLLDPDNAVQFGMSATVTFTDAGAGLVARIPLAAVVDRGDGPAVWQIDPESKTIALHPVIIIGYDTQDALIYSGVPEGATIVALGAHKLNAGQKVRIVRSIDQ